MSNLEKWFFRDCEDECERMMLARETVMELDNMFPGEWSNADYDIYDMCIDYLERKA